MVKLTRRSQRAVVRLPVSLAAAEDEVGSSQPITRADVYPLLVARCIARVVRRFLVACVHEAFLALDLLIKALLVEGVFA
jgi:hypothetical protein